MYYIRLCNQDDNSIKVVTTNSGDQESWFKGLNQGHLNLPIKDGTME